MIDLNALKHFLSTSKIRPAIFATNSSERADICWALNELGYKWSNGETYINDTGGYYNNLGTIFFPREGTR